jgi:hypothetical protein
VALLRYFRTVLLAGWLFSQQREGHSRIYGTVIFGFTKTGLMKKAWSGAVYIRIAFILLILKFPQV